MKLKRRTRVEKGDSAPEVGLNKLNGGREKAAEHKVRGQAHKVAGQLEPYTESARQAVTHRASDAWEWAEPRLEHAAETVQKDIAPRVSSALNTAAERSAPAREEAVERGTAAVAALRGEPAKAAPQKRRWPLAVLFFFVGGALGAAGGILGQRFAPGQSVSADGGSTASGNAGARDDGDHAADASGTSSQNA